MVGVVVGSVLWWWLKSRSTMGASAALMAQLRAAALWALMSAPAVRRAVRVVKGRVVVVLGRVRRVWTSLKRIALRMSGAGLWRRRAVSLGSLVAMVGWLERVSRPR